uniref:IRS-type PTB domain-containing protein n=1 Tax=Panagrellus redivivus TaxID=6233 RepID=A0A7E4WCY3_PANRE
MGNCTSDYKRNGVFQEDYGDDPSAFRVFIKRRNKFLQGWLKIADEEIIFSRGGGNIECWPLAYLRRYGYTRAGIFFFESGRRCKSGEGLHTFQSHQAERIFQIVQLRIKNVEIRASRASSVASQRFNSVSSNSRIHPVQRFSSEGANGTLFNVNQQHQSGANQVPALPSRTSRSGSLLSQQQLSFVEAWPNEPAPSEADIVNEHVLRAKKPAIDPISRQRKYHSYVNVDIAERVDPGITYASQGSLHSPRSAFSAHSMPGHNSMSASYCGPSTSTINGFEPMGALPENEVGPRVHRGSIDPMSMSATAALGYNMDGGRISYTTLAMPENVSSSGSSSSRRTTSTSQRSDISSASAPPLRHNVHPIAPYQPNKQSTSVNYARVEYPNTNSMSQVAPGIRAPCRANRHYGTAGPQRGPPPMAVPPRRRV